MEKRTRVVVSLSFASFLLAGGLIMSGCSKSSDVPPTAQAVVATVGVETPTVVSVETPAAESLATQAPDATTAVAESTAITEAASLTATGNKVTIENVTFSSDPALATLWSGGLVEGNSDPNVPPNPFTEPR